jgi:hypothetical protein
MSHPCPITEPHMLVDCLFAARVLVDWDSPTWGVAGVNVHTASWAPDRHTQEGDDE